MISPRSRLQGFCIALGPTFRAVMLGQKDQGLHSLASYAARHILVT